MKLRNKNTGEIVEFITIDLVDDNEIEFTYVQYDGDEKSLAYRTLKNFNNEWEDYVPRKPLIKDEKVRKAIMAWYEALPLDGLTEKRILFSNGDFCVGIYRIDCGNYVAVKDIKERFYTIKELCGEEK